MVLIVKGRNTEKLLVYRKAVLLLSLKSVTDLMIYILYIVRRKRKTFRGSGFEREGFKLPRLAVSFSFPLAIGAVDLCGRSVVTPLVGSSLSVDAFDHDDARHTSTSHSLDD